MKDNDKAKPKSLNAEHLAYAHGYGVGYDCPMETATLDLWGEASGPRAYAIGLAHGKRDRKLDNKVYTPAIIRDARKRAVLDPAYNPDTQVRPTIVLVDVEEVSDGTQASEG